MTETAENSPPFRFAVQRASLELQT